MDLDPQTIPKTECPNGWNTELCNHHDTLLGTLIGYLLGVVLDPLVRGFGTPYAVPLVWGVRTSPLKGMHSTALRGVGTLLMGC